MIYSFPTLYLFCFLVWFIINFAQYIDILTLKLSLSSQHFLLNYKINW